MYGEQWIVGLSLAGGIIFGLVAAFAPSRRVPLAISAVILFLPIGVRDSNGSMGKDCHRADQTGHVRGNPACDTLPDLWRVADTVLQKGALAAHSGSRFRCIRAEAGCRHRRRMHSANG